MLYLGTRTGNSLAKNIKFVRSNYGTGRLERKCKECGVSEERERDKIIPGKLLAEKENRKYNSDSRYPSGSDPYGSAPTNDLRPLQNWGGLRPEHPERFPQEGTIGALLFS
jgi:hypothetical protein